MAEVKNTSMYADNLHGRYNSKELSITSIGLTWSTYIDRRPNNIWTTVNHFRSYGIYFLFLSLHLLPCLRPCLQTTSQTMNWMKTCMCSLFLEPSVTTQTHANSITFSMASSLNISSSSPICQTVTDLDITHAEIKQTPHSQPPLVGLILVPYKIT